MAYVLVTEDMAIYLDLVSKIVLLVVDLWIIRLMLRCEIRRENSDLSADRLQAYDEKRTCEPYHRVSSLGLCHHGPL